MNDALSLNVNKIECQKTGDHRIEAFQQSLADVFRQFQTLLDYCKEVEAKYEAVQVSAKKSINDDTKDDESKCSQCGVAVEKNDKTSEPGETAASSVVTNGEKVPSDLESVRKRGADEGNPNLEQSYEIYSQDFCTQGLEDSFLKHQTTPLQEIQNLTPKRSKSPIFSSKKAKSARTVSPPISSPSLSERSVVILDIPRTTSNSETFSVTETQASIPDDATIVKTPKSVNTWGFSTIQNVSTDVILGSKKKLKQSKIFLRTEKVTDLSVCDDVCDTGKETKSKYSASRNCTQIDNSCVEDSLIQVSPTQDRGLSKMKQRIARRNKSAETLQKKFNRNYAEVVKKVDPVVRTDTEVTIFEPQLASTQLGDSLSSSKAVETKKSSRYPEIIKKNDPVAQTDTEMTIFEPDLALTRCGGSPSRSRAVAAEEITTGLAEGRIDDSEIIDDTLFVENVSANKSWSQKQSNFEISGSRTKSLSLRKMPKKNSKEVSPSSSEKVKGESPPRKKLARDYYDKPAKKRAASPTYAYKRSPVRKQAEKKLLNGWSCLECQNYYEALGLSEEELQKRKDACSRHRSKFDEQKCTQQGYWNPDFTSSFHSTVWGDD